MILYYFFFEFIMQLAHFAQVVGDIFEIDMSHCKLQNLYVEPLVYALRYLILLQLAVRDTDISNFNLT